MNRPRPQRLLQLPPALLAFLAYIGAASLFTWPVLARLGQAIPGQDTDAFLHLWNYDWVKQALFTGHNPFYTDLLFYPRGVALYTHNIPWLNIGMWLPLQGWLGAETAYSLVYISVLAINGLTVYLLARHLLGQKLENPDGPAFIAGWLTTGWPYLVSRHSSPNLIFIAGIPLTLLALSRLIQSGRRRDLFFLAASLALLGLARFQWLLMGMVLILPFGLVSCWIWRPGWRGARRLFLGGLLGGIMLLPTAGPLLWHQVSQELLPEAEAIAPPFSNTDLLAYLIPTPGHPLWGDWAQWPNLATRYPIGLVTLALVAVGVVAAQRRGWLWLGLAGLTLLLALGDRLTILGRPTIPLPFGWLDQLSHGLLRAVVRYPSRLNALLVIPVALLAAWGVAALLRRIPVQRRMMRAGLAALIAVAIGVEDLYVHPTLDLAVPGWYDTLAAEPERFGLVQIPLDRGFDELYMLYQRRHGKPMVEGHVSRPPSTAFDFIDSVPLLAYLHASADLREQLGPPPAEMDSLAQLHLLQAANFRYVVLHKQLLTGSALFGWKGWFLVPPHYEDNQVVVYATDASLADGAYPVTPELAVVGAEIFPLSLRPGDGLTGQVDWLVTQQPPAGSQFCLELTRASKIPAQANCFDLSLDRQGAVGRWLQTLVVDSQLPPGPYTVWGRLRDQQTIDMAPPLLLGVVELLAPDPQFGPPDAETLLAVDLGAALTLVGFDSPQVSVGRVLTVPLYWQARQTMAVNYKFFVHLIHVESDVPAAQIDYMAQDWTYPTSQWRAGEVVADVARLPVAHLPAGSYRVVVGAYDPDTGERLAPASDVSVTVQDRAMVLGEVVLGEMVAP